MVELDDLDYQIVKVLMKNGQTSNSDLSRMMGTSVNTIRNRIQRLIDSKVIQIIGVTNPMLLGFDVHTIMGVDVSYPKLTEVANGFAEMKAVRYVAYAAGVHDLVVMAFFIKMDDFFNWMEEYVSKIDGIVSIKTMFVSQEVKRTYDYVGHLEELKQNKMIKEGNNDH